MDTDKILGRITINSKVMVGKPTIRGLRITVEQILNALGGGVTADELLKDYPELEADDIQAAILYASRLISEEHIYQINVNKAH